ncbi:MAG: peptidase M64 [Melioribacteraceae bacterium]|nr:peptidase M64 [Melioribacteraceae bacterium]
MSVISAQSKFDEYFYDKTMRVDYFHIGTDNNEEYILDEIIEEPIYPGTKTALIDTFFYGNHFFNVYDYSSNTLLYSKGFSSLFQEWQTTDEAKILKRSFEETIVFPYPRNKIRLEILSRNKKKIFEKKFELEIDPDDYFIRTEQKLKFETKKIHYSGDPSENLDIVFIPEGYTKDQLNNFIDKCKSMVEYLFTYDPFINYKNSINVWAVMAPSLEQGADIPGDDKWVNTLVNSSYYTFNSERYLMKTSVKNVRDVASNAPYEQIVILVNSEKYGGGGIYNYYSITCANDERANRVFVHEFGHGFAGLADEYGADDTYNEFYPLDTEPWEPNITTLVDFDKKWKNMIQESTPVPTPDEKDYYDVVGLFEGAGYVNKGVYRPTHSSIMRVLSAESFNEPSVQAIERLIKFYSGK